MDKNIDKLEQLFTEIFNEDTLLKIIFPESVKNPLHTAKL